MQKNRPTEEKWSLLTITGIFHVTSSGEVSASDELCVRNMKTKALGR
ncbi:MAG: hypothetical protein PVF53_03085 [Desulfobacterales bacterium]